MKKGICRGILLLLVLCLFVCLYSCGKKEEPDSGNPPTVSPPTEPDISPETPGGSEEPPAPDDSESEDVSGYFTYETTKVGSSYEVTITGLTYEGYLHCATLVIPEKIGGNPVTAIAERAFAYYSGITEITIPKTVTSVGADAFFECTGLLLEKDGVCYAGKWAVASLETVSGAITLDSGTLGIADNTFADRWEITGVSLPSSLLHIGDNAFLNCVGLTSINIPNSTLTIGDGAYCGCLNLRSVGISIGNYSKLEKIGEDAFYGCSSLSSMTIPAGVKQIGDYAFYGCHKLIEVANYSVHLDFSAGKESNGHLTAYSKNVCGKYGKTSKLVEENGFLFYRDTDLSYLVEYCGEPKSDLALPANFEGKKYAIYAYAFAGCDWLYSITIPANIADIGPNAFEGCSRLIQKENGIHYVGKWVVGMEKGLENVTLRSDTIGIAARAFYGCKSIVSITLPRQLMRIGEEAFLGCERLIEVLDESDALVIRAGSKENGYVAHYARIVAGADGGSISTTADGFRFFDAGNTCILVGYTGNREHVVLPDHFGGRTYEIGTYAFYNKTKIKSMTIPEGVTALGDNAFEGCLNLSAIYVEDIATWCSFSFATASANPLFLGAKLYVDGELPVDVEIPATVTSLSNYLFYKCDTIQRLSFAADSALELIGKQAFYGCVSLSSVELPAGLKEISAGAFSGCTSLVRVDAPSLTSFMGISFSDASANPVSLAGRLWVGGEELVDLEIPYQQTSIGPYAFYGCVGLRSFTLPSGSTLTEIGKEAFEGCTGLVRVDVSSISDWLKISFDIWSSNPLYQAGRLFVEGKEVHSLTLNQYGLRIIKDYAFYNCQSLIQVVIGSSIDSIGHAAFSGCHKLIQVRNDSIDLTVKNDSKNGSVGLYAEDIQNKTIGSNTRHRGEFITTEDGFVFYKSAVTRALIAYVGDQTALTLPENFEGYSYTIYNRAFYKMDDLISVTFPARAVTEIGQGAFYGCLSLGAVVFEAPDSNVLKTVSASAFQGCASLRTFTVPSRVEKIDVEAFLGCWRLAEIYNLTTGLELTLGGRDHGYLAYYARAVYGDVQGDEGRIVTDDGYVFFVDHGVYYLSGYEGSDTHLTLPDACNGERYLLADRAFFGRRDLLSVTLPAWLGEISKEAFAGSGIERIALPEALTVIGESAFLDCAFLTELVLPEGVIEIGHSAFSGCARILNVTVPQGVSQIGSKTFQNCVSLESVTVPSGVTQIGTQAFEGCVRLKTIALPTGLAVIDGGVFLGCKSLSYVTVPGMVTAIGQNAFADCTGLVSIQLPMGLETIGSGAFRDCDSLLEVLIPASVLSVMDNAFSGCDRLENVFFGEGSNLSYLSEIAFKNCSQLNYTYENNGQYLGTVQNPYFILVGIEDKMARSFTAAEGTRYVLACQGLRVVDVTLPEGVLYIAKGAFRDNAKLARITLPDSLLRIEYAAFSGCEKLRRVTFSEESMLQYIGESAFGYCESLVSITIPENVTSIGASAFYGCLALREVYFNAVNCADANRDRGWFGVLQEKTADMVLYIGEGVVRIPASAFYSTAVCEVQFDKNSVLSEIGANAFAYCQRLKTIALPGWVSIIGESAFCECKALEAVELSNGLTVIGGAAFLHTSLKEISLPATLLEIGTRAFAKTLQLKTVTFAEDSVLTTLGESAFEESGITSITLPFYVARIEESAFEMCQFLKEVTLSGATEYIGSYAFKNCRSLKSLVMPAALSYIGYNAFVFCNSLETVTFEEKEGWIYASNSSGTSGTPLVIEENAARQLQSGYVNSHWHRK